MITQYGKRALSLFLVIIMIFTAVPVQAFAVEDEYNHEHQTEDGGVVFDLAEVPEGAAVSGESEALIALRAEIAAYVEALGITPNMSDQYLLYAYGNHESQEAAEASLTKQDEFWAKGARLSEEEQQILLAEPNTELCIRYREVAQNAYGMMGAEEVCPIANVSVNLTVDGQMEHDNGRVTVIVAGQDGCNSESATATIDIYNESEKTATVAFDWAATNVNELKIDGEVKTGTTGSFSKVLDAGGSFTVTITTGKNATKNKLEMSNFSLTEVAAQSDVTFEYDSSLGSITVGGTAVNSGAAQTISSADGAALVATPENGAKFLGWIDGNNKLLSKENPYTLTPAADMSVRAVFAENGGKPWFMVDNRYLYDNLNTAVTKGATIVLANDGTLPAGDYTIPAGVTLLIPFDDANTLYTSDPGYVDAKTSPQMFRTLTMQDGAKITVKGAMSLSGKLATGQPYTAAPTGDTSMVKMSSGSEIEVAGGTLYAWGFITGSGSVHVTSGGTVFEPFQIAGWRGGSALLSMNNNTQRVFPLSQYFIQNIEVPLTLDAGAVEKAYVCAKVIGTAGSSETFIGDGGMFNVVEGSITKDYNEQSDRLEFTVNGKLQMNNMKVSLSGFSVDSQSYELPITNNITVRVGSGSSIEVTQNLAMLPGAQMYVKDGAQVSLKTGVSVFFYDADQWNGKNYCFDNKDFYSVNYAPGKAYNRTASDLKDAYAQIEGTFDASNGFIYTTQSGANITATEGAKVILQPGTDTVTYQATQSGTTIDYKEIPITPAKLKNADGTYVGTDKAGTYNYVGGRWTFDCGDGNHSWTDATCTAPKTCSVCNATEGEALGHSWTDATCTAPKTCSACGATEGEALGHSWTDATCTAPKTCSVCGATEGEALGHSWTDADCDTPKTCSVCGATEGEALDHSFTNYVSDGNATCTADGTKTAKCDGCDETDTVADEGSKLDHSFTNYVSDGNATCTEDGTKTAKCDGCDETDTVADEGSKLDHSFTNYVSDGNATCTEDGTKTAKCDRCDVTDTAADEGSALGHTEITVERQEPTCTEPGHEAGVKCEVCGNVLSGMTEITAPGHDLLQYEAKEPTCAEVGWDAYEECQREGCDYTTYKERPTADHDWVKYDAKAPTYTEDGYDAHKVCTVCGTSEPENYEIYPALGVPTVDDYDEFVFNLQLLEQLAEAYVQENPGKDPVALVIKYIRTGVDRYNSGSWGIMAGYEDTDFANFVRRMENQINAGGGYDFDGNGENELMAVTAMKNIVDFTLPNGDTVDFGHMFGTMDITYHNTGSQNHADVGGWAGDLVDLMTAADRAYTSSADSSVKLDPNVDLETMTQQIRDEIFLKTTCADDKFALTDWYGDIDAMYVMNSLYAEDDYTVGMMADIISGYCTENLDDVDRAEYFLKQRLDNPGTRAQVRAAVYEAYCDNKTITTLEATRDFGNTDAKYLEQLRRASCYAFADYICRLAGDWVEISENPYYTDFSSETSVLAPGITQEIHKATSADNKQMVYYLAIADLTNSKVTVNANYNENDPSEWKMARVLDQANAAQDKYGDPNSEHYIPNYQVVAAINADGFNMSTGEPGGLLVMDGKEWHPANSNGFFGITKEGKPVIGTTKEYNSIYKGQLRDAVAAFGTTLVKDGKISITASSDYYTNRASRTAVGITKTGKVVFMVLDGRQEPVSCGGSMEEIAQIMLEAGCEIAINLDGGGSTTFVSKPEGSDALQVTSKPSDGYARSVSSTLIMVSTAPSSTAFDHAILNSDYDYATIGTAVTMTPVGVSATGNVAELPEGYTWAVSNDKWGTVTQDGIFTGLRTGDVEVMLMLDDKVIGSKTINIVTPASVYFTRSTIDAVYGQTITLPVAALYEGKPVAISEDDVTLTAAVNAGTISGFKFTAAEESNIRNFKITAALKADADVNGSITVNLYKQGENTFDFEKATAGDRQLAWSREVSNSTTDDAMTYTAIARDGDMVTSYIFAMDMTQIPIPTNLEDLVYMLPGADAANASAWNFLLQLAERVSVLTEVTPVIDFDDRFEVDYSELKILNEYFKLQENGVTFDESTNTLTMTLNWVDQTKAIDAATANPLCLVSGIKLTPKDAAFVNDRFTAVNSGEIGYKIYLRANALYSFSQKPENQQKYGLKPFTNRYTDANGETKDESGGYMQNVYKNFEDTYTLSYAEKQGWVRESGGYAYYKDGAKLTGVKQVDGYYYDFGTKGINIGQTKYTGIFAENSKNYCAKLGEIVYSDWTLIDGEMWHSNANGVAHKAEKRGSMTCTRGGYASYECDACNVSQKLGDYVMPSGHDWDVNHVCKTCGYKGKDIAKATIGFGTISKPIAVTPVPKYYYQSGGVRPVTYLTFDGRNALTKSSDATLNSDGTMRDVFVSWTNGTGIGKAVVHFAGKGNYYGTATLDYIIVPCDVTTLKTSAVSAEAVTLTWTAPAGARTYTIYKDVDGKYEAIAENVSGTSYTVTGLEAGVKYKFAVKGSAPSTDGENVQYYSAKYSNTVTVLDGKATVQSSTSGGGAISGGGGAAGGGGGGAAGGGAAVPEGATASSVTSMIDKLGNITLADKETLAEIREAYDSLTTSQRLKVENYEALLAAEEKLAELEKAQQTDTVTTAVFEDVKEEHWFHNNVYDAYGRGLMKGTSDTEFEPQQSLSRAMLVTILYRLESEPAISGTNDFGDVKDGLWYSDAITWAAANEIVNGMGEGIFAPNQNVSREQTAAILMRYSQYKGYDVTNDGDLSRYLDAHMVSAWAEDYMEWANHTGLIAGDAAGRLNPQGNATRAEAATILIRYIDNIAS